MKYRKKPVCIEAVLFKGWDRIGVSHEKTVNGYPEWLEKAFERKDVVFKPEKNIICITTLEGVMTANVGDYIIQGVQNEIYPCKPDIFEATYEKV